MRTRTCSAVVDLPIVVGSGQNVDTIQVSTTNFSPASAHS
jgi:hypothetical protein